MLDILARKRNIILCGIVPKYGGRLIAPYLLKSYINKDKKIIRKYNIYVHDYCDDQDSAVVINEIIERDPALVGFSTYVWNVRKVLEICSGLKKINESVIIVLGGPEAGGLKDELLVDNTSIDAIVIGEGEAVFSDILKEIFPAGTGKENLTNITGLCFRSGNRCITTAPRQPMQNLDEIPSIYVGRYASRVKPGRLAVIENARGCTFRCNFCGWPDIGSRKRYYSLDKVLREVAHLLEVPDPSVIYISDADIFSDTQRLESIMDIVQRRNRRNKHIFIEGMADNFNFKLIDIFKKIDMSRITINFAVQSVDKTVQEMSNRYFDTEKVREVVTALQKHINPFSLHLDVMFGLPGDSFAGFKKTLNFCLSLRPEQINIFHALILPGTWFYKYSKEYNLTFEKNAPHAVLESPSFPKDDIGKAKRLSVFIIVMLKIPSARKEIYAEAVSRGIEDLAGLLQNFFEHLQKSRMLENIFPELLRYEIEEARSMWTTDISFENVGKLVNQFFLYLKEMPDPRNLAENKDYGRCRL